MAISIGDKVKYNSETWIIKDFEIEATGEKKLEFCFKDKYLKQKEVVELFVIIEKDGVTNRVHRDKISESK